MQPDEEVAGPHLRPEDDEGSRAGRATDEGGDMTTEAATVDEFDRGRLVAIAQRTVDINAALDRLERDFRGIFNRETIERFIYDSAARLGEAKVTTYVPIIAERFAKERLKALARVEGRMLTTIPSVLFLCTHNAGRSQIAAGWVKQLVGDRVLVWSGGSDPTSEVNPAAIEAMNEVGIDIAQEFPKPWTDEIVRAADVVVTMGCGDACPIYPGVRYIDWEVDDPAEVGLDAVRAIRDDIEGRVRTLVEEMQLAAKSGAA